MMRMACVSATRMTGSPMRAVKRPRKAVMSSTVSVSSRTMRPVNISPQVEALTNSE